MKGADPEVFVSRDGNIVPVIGLIGGTKRRPRPLGVGAIQEDNVLAEFNIPPASSVSEWASSLTSMLSSLRLLLADKGCDISIESSYNFDEGVLLDAGPKAMELGCDPDFNAWSGLANRKPVAGSLRTAAGHIHIGMEGLLQDDVERLVQSHDLFLGVPSIIMDKDKMRRSMYGQAGAYRRKPYGFEYRTLSNFWLKSKELMAWAYEQSERALEFSGSVDGRVQQCINNHDELLAYQLINEYELEMVA